MAAANGNYELWKVADLRKELSLRRLSPIGEKTDLVRALQLDDSKKRGGRDRTPPRQSAINRNPARGRSHKQNGAVLGSPNRLARSSILAQTLTQGSPVRAGASASSPKRRPEAEMSTVGRPILLEGRPTIYTGSASSSQAASPSFMNSDELPGPASSLESLSLSAPHRPAPGLAAFPKPIDAVKRRRTDKGAVAVNVDTIEVDAVNSGLNGSVPPPPASLGLRARQLRTLLLGGVCDDLQQPYSELLASFYEEAKQDSNSSPAAASTEDHLEDLESHDAVLSAALKRAQRVIVESAKRSSSGNVWLQKLKNKEARQVPDETLEGSADRTRELYHQCEQLHVALGTVMEDLAERLQTETAALHESYEGAINSLEQQLEIGTDPCDAPLEDGPDSNGSADVVAESPSCEANGESSCDLGSG